MRILESHTVIRPKILAVIVFEVFEVFECAFVLCASQRLLGVSRWPSQPRTQDAHRLAVPVVFQQQRFRRMNSGSYLKPLWRRKLAFRWCQRVVAPHTLLASPLTWRAAQCKRWQGLSAKRNETDFAIELVFQLPKDGCS